MNSPLKLGSLSLALNRTESRAIRDDRRHDFRPYRNIFRGVDIGAGRMSTGTAKE